MSHQHMKNEQKKGEKGLSKSLNSPNLFHKYTKKKKLLISRLITFLP